MHIHDGGIHHQHLWALALYGVRRGEIAGLRWANVDLKAKTIRIEENRVALGKQIASGRPKSKASNRTLPMPDDVVDLLKTARKRQTEERMRFGEGYGAGDYVAVDEAGVEYHPNPADVPVGKASGRPRDTPCAVA